MIIPLGSTTLLIQVNIQNGQNLLKFGDISLLRGCRVKGMMKLDRDNDFYNGHQYLTLDIKNNLHFRKFPIDAMRYGNKPDTFSLTTESVVNWSNSFVEFDTPAVGLPPEGKNITFLVIYEPVAKK